MQLSLHTDLGLRLLMVLARADGRTVALPEFAASQVVSYNHMLKVVQSLLKAGYVQTTRGRTGGVRLARLPQDIVIGQVVRALEPGMKAADCNSCNMRSDCRLQGLLGEAMSQFLAALDARTLADVAPSRMVLA